MNDAQVLEVRGLALRLGSREVLREVSFGPLPRGSFTALLGSNAAGKSTLLRRIAGQLDGPGTVEIMGRPLSGWPQGHRHRPAHVPQESNMASSLRVLEAVLLAAKQQGGWRVQCAELDRVLAVLRALKIDTLAQRELAALSGGQRQLVSLAQALVREPSLLLLDEPTSALDLKRQFEVLSLLRRMTHEAGMTVLVAIHDLNLAMRFADRIVVLHAGRVAADGVPAEVITPALLARIYGVQARVEPCSQGYPQVIVDAALTPDG